MEDLNELRKEIDTIDKAMVDLFEKRMDVSRRVAGVQDCQWEKSSGPGAGAAETGESWCTGT